MTASSDALLFGFWTSIMAGFCYLWATMLVAWWMHRDDRSLVYVVLLLQLSLISGINAVIRGDLFGLDANAMIAVQRGIWFAALITSFGIVDIYNSARRNKSAKAFRWWQKVTHQDADVGNPETRVNVGT